MTPAPPMPPRRATLLRVVGLFHPHWKSAILVAIAVVTASTLGLANPLLVRQITDYAIPRRDLGLLGLCAAAMVLVTILSGAIDTLETWETTRVGQRVMFTLRTRVYAHLQK